MGTFSMRELTRLSSAETLAQARNSESSNRSILTKLSIDRTKSLARREAWYGSSWNPFRRFKSNESRGSDIEEGFTGGEGQHTTDTPGANGDAIQSTVVGESSANGEKSQMRGANASEDTAVDSQSTGRPRSEEHKARSRFMSTFHRKKSDSTSDQTRTETGMTGKTNKSGRASMKHKKFTFRNQIQATLFNSWINVLLIAAPVGIALHFVPGMKDEAIFVVNFIAIIPLAALLSYATEEIALRVGETLGGLLNASFGYVPSLLY